MRLLLRRALVVLTAGGLAHVPAHGGDAQGSAAWGFNEVTAPAGLAQLHRYDPLKKPIEPRWISAGAAVGDVDGDGDLDLFIVGGEWGQDVFYRNRGDGTFEDASVASGLNARGRLGSGPIFVDLDGDRDLDLLSFSVSGSPEVPSDPPVAIPEALTKVYRNRGDGTFDDISAESGLGRFYAPTYAGALADVDLDGDLDLFLSHWRFPTGGFLWAGDGTGSFVDVTGAAIGTSSSALLPFSFTPTFADFDGDGWPDLAVAGDFGTSQVLRNQGGGSFVAATSASVTDENGMGAVVGDFDGDQQLDWFVSSIWDPDGIPDGTWGVSGNRLYRGTGGFDFADATDTAGVRQGYWGWGACAADLDLDGDLDLIHTNGFNALGASEFHADPVRLYVNQGAGTFDEEAFSLGTALPEQTRGVVCFDYDRDGDLDLLFAINNGAARLFRNELDLAERHYLSVSLRGQGTNTHGIGARVTLEAGGLTQVRELRAGGGFVASGPPELHFGLGASVRVDRLEIRWPQGVRSVLGGVSADRAIEVDERLIFSDGFETGDTAGWLFP